MGGLFSHERKNEVAKPVISKKDEAILQLKLQIDNLRKYQKKACYDSSSSWSLPLVQLEVVLAKEVEAIRLLTKQGKQKQALLALKKKKYQENLIEKTEPMLLNLQEMV